MIDLFTIYLVIAIVCVVLLVVMAALGGFHDMDLGGDADVDAGGHFDAGHGDYSGATLSPLSVPILLAFGATFGAIGAMLTEPLANDYLVVVISIVAGVAVAGGMYLLVYGLIVKSQASTHVSMKDFIGLEGLLTVAIKKGAPGEVVVNTEKRGRTPVAATAQAEIPANTPVRVIGVSGDAVIVEKKEE